MPNLSLTFPKASLSVFILAVKFILPPTHELSFIVDVFSMSLFMLWSCLPFIATFMPLFSTPFLSIWSSMLISAPKSPSVPPEMLTFAPSLFSKSAKSTAFTLPPTFKLPCLLWLPITAPPKLTSPFTFPFTAFCATMLLCLLTKLDSDLLYIMPTFPEASPVKIVLLATPRETSPPTSIPNPIELFVSTADCKFKFATSKLISLALIFPPIIVVSPTEAIDAPFFAVNVEFV